MDPSALLKGLEVAPSFVNRGNQKASAFGNRTPLTRAISQYLNPLGGSLQRLPPGSSGQMSMTPTAMASTHQVLRFQVPTDYQAVPSSEQPLLLTSLDAGGLATYTPLYDFSQGVPIVHFWDSCTPLAYPSFSPNPSYIIYGASKFVNLLNNRVTANSDQNGSSYLFNVRPTMIIPQALKVTSPDIRGGPYRPLARINDTVCFWCDNGTDVSFRVISVYSGTHVAGNGTVTLWYVGSSGDPQTIAEDTTQIPSTGSANTYTVRALSSGWHYVTYSCSIQVSTVPSNTAAFNIDSFQTVSAFRRVHTAFLTNTSYIDNVDLIQSDRLLGTSVQAYCSSPVLQVGGRILASVGHVFSGDFRLATSNLSKSVNNSPNCSFYDGPLLTQGDADGGIYSIVTPRRAFVMEDVDSISSPSELERANFAVSDLFANAENNFGYNVIVFRPSYADGVSSVEFEIVCAQSTEYSTASQFLYTEKSRMSQVEMLQLLDMVRSVQPFCPNPFHLKMVRDFLSRAASAVKEGAGVAAKSLPYAAQIAAALGHPEIAAILRGVSSGARVIHAAAGGR